MCDLFFFGSTILYIFFYKRFSPYDHVTGMSNTDKVNISMCLCVKLHIYKCDTTQRYWCFSYHYSTMKKELILSVLWDAHFIQRDTFSLFLWKRIPSGYPFIFHERYGKQTYENISLVGAIDKTYKKYTLYSRHPAISCLSNICYLAKQLNDTPTVIKSCYHGSS